MPFFFFFSIFYTNSTNSIARNNKGSRFVTAFKTTSSRARQGKATADPCYPGASQSSCRAEYLCVFLKNNFFEGPSL